MSDAEANPEAPKPLPPRAPRSVVVHWAVDAAVAFLVLIVPATFLGLGLFGISVVAALAGVIAAPWTLRREAEALARRPPPDETID